MLLLLLRSQQQQGNLQLLFLRGIFASFIQDVYEI